jgi:hypothetical protein
VLQFNQFADTELHSSSELAAVAGNIRNDYAAPRAIAQAGGDIVVGLTAKLPSCSPVDVSHRFSLKCDRLMSEFGASMKATFERVPILNTDELKLTKRGWRAMSVVPFGSPNWRRNARI